MALSAEENQPHSSVFGRASEERPDGLADTELFIQKAFAENPRMGLELLFRRYYQPLYSHATRLVYSADIAADIVSDVFLNFWQKEAYRNVQSSYRAYLMMSVRYAAFAHLRREFNVDSLDSTGALDVPTPTLSADQIMAYDELYLQIDQAIRALPTQNQRVFMLSRFEGKSHGEIAQLLNISPKTVEVHIHKALRILRQIVAGM